MQILTAESIKQLVFQGRGMTSSAKWSIESEPGITSEAYFEIGADSGVRFGVSERRAGDRMEVVSGTGTIDQEGSLVLTDDAADAFQVFMESLALRGVTFMVGA